MMQKTILIGLASLAGTLLGAKGAEYNSQGKREARRPWLRNAHKGVKA